MTGFINAASEILPPVILSPRPDERNRIFDTVKTFWLFLNQVLAGNLSLDATVQKAIEWLQGTIPQKISPNTSAYSQARKRFPQAEIDRFHEVMRLDADDTPDFHGKRVKAVDGTGLLVEESEANREAFPPNHSTKKNPGFPALKLLVVFSLATGLAVHWVLGGSREVDNTMYRRLWQVLSPGDLSLGDRHFCTYASYSLLLKRGVDSVSRLHQIRTKATLVKTLGRNDRIVEWRKPPKQHPWCTPEDWATIPETLRVREITYQVVEKGFRSQRITIVTTVLDTTIPASDWIELYRKRWDAELNLRHIKTTMQMDFIKAGTPEMVKKVIGFFLLAYNLIRLLMLKASNSFGVPLEKLSFKSTVTALCSQCLSLAIATTPEEYEAAYQRMLRCIAYPRLRNPKNRVEPRARKRRPKPYRLLMGDRHTFQVESYRGKRKYA